MSFYLRGTLEGHEGWVTSLATTSEKPNSLVSASRDKTVMLWNLTREQGHYGLPFRAMKGHSHFVEDVQISSDGQYALSASWDATLRLWDLSSGVTTRLFKSHTKDILSVGFSVENRQIVSGSRDKTIKLWNTLGECKFTATEGGHSDWVSCVRFSPNVQAPAIVSGGWDRIVKVWDMNKYKLKTNLIGHTGYVNTVTISPDGSLCASGGKDGTAMLWDLNMGQHLYSLNAGSEIRALAFSPNRYWLCAATNNGLRIWDLERKNVVADLTAAAPGFDAKSKTPYCLSLAWSADGTTLFSGHADNLIRCWEVSA